MQQLLRNALDTWGLLTIRKTQTVTPELFPNYTPLLICLQWPYVKALGKKRVSSVNNSFRLFVRNRAWPGEKKWCRKSLKWEAQFRPPRDCAGAWREGGSVCCGLIDAQLDAVKFALGLIGGFRVKPSLFVGFLTMPPGAPKLEDRSEWLDYRVGAASRSQAVPMPRRGVPPTCRSSRGR